MSQRDAARGSPPPISASLEAIIAEAREASLRQYRQILCPCGSEVDWTDHQLRNEHRCRACQVRAAHQAAVERAMSTVPDFCRGLRFEASDLEDRTRDAKRLRDSWAQILAARWVTIVGASSAGKTSAMATMFRHVAEREPMGALWVSAFELGKSREAHGLGSEPPLLLAALSARVLALDELGSEPAFHKSPIGEVIYQRHSEGRRTWITTPFDEAALSAKYGAGFGGRRLFDERSLVIEMGVGVGAGKQGSRA